ncbi:hypothetical protein SCATT_09380 [Streptantibioticus cattleyicolor NRRL 8057 = DSM 46488]|uniref:Uncharacterized protein n=1 Tax=Streptantibioticus cattleyicolor (strain ATCC 35852 / DSM 46488 / JCM 4925 / NBRC 14057 / NRRL 8057) TaxID=1003195 RepID=G8WN26_STREN|nr:hypothetical protein SCATT_09380 [Streptantibioticus cattleyicolor NRRL 8057 = DSM 46488]
MRQSHPVQPSSRHQPYFGPPRAAGAGAAPWINSASVMLPVDLAATAAPSFGCFADRGRGRRRALGRRVNGGCGAVTEG